MHSTNKHKLPPNQMKLQCNGTSTLFGNIKSRSVTISYRRCTEPLGSLLNSTALVYSFLALVLPFWAQCSDLPWGTPHPYLSSCVQGGADSSSFALLVGLGHRLTNNLSDISAKNYSCNYWNRNIKCLEWMVAVFALCGKNLLEKNQTEQMRHYRGDNWPRALRLPFDAQL